MYDDGKLGAIRNPDGIWINSSVFQEAGKHFTKYGYYVADPWGSPAWIDFWKEEKRKCIEGVTIGGVKITGDHYFYLNYTQILKAENIIGDTADKVEGFPDFWDGDYNYFWIREIARKGIYKSLLPKDKFREFAKSATEKQKIALYDSLGLEVKIPLTTSVLIDDVEITRDNLAGGFDVLVGKARRRGYSLKSASIGACNFFTKPNSYTAYAAYNSDFLYPMGTFTHALGVINFVNINTGWTMPSDVTAKNDNIKGSYYEYVNGNKQEKGFKSVLQAVSYKDNPNPLRGKNLYDGFFEESGASGTIGLLSKTVKATQPAAKAGGVKTGLITVFGTSGEMERGSADYADMTTRPEAFGFLPFFNIWRPGHEKEKTCFFHPINWNMEGFYDSQGNSDRESARKRELTDRKILIKNGATSTDMQKHMQEFPLDPGEAFGSVSANIFPVVELKNQLAKVKANDLQRKKGMPVELVANGNTIIAKPILDSSQEPITGYYHMPENKRGCVIIYEQPISNPEMGLYKIGYDPVSQDKGSSLAAVFVYKSVQRGARTHSIMVAEYVGRREEPDDIHAIVEKLAIYYHTQIMFENNVADARTYFTRRMMLHLLALQPNNVITKNVKNSKVARIYGCHMIDPLKDAGERYLKQWLLTKLDFDENGESVTVIDRIYSIRFLEELIAYNRDGNFDLVSAAFMCMFQVNEEILGKEYNTQSTEDSVGVQIAEMMARTRMISKKCDLYATI